MDPSLLSPLPLTLKVAAVATLMALAAGVALALWVTRSRFPGREALDAALTLPLVLPPTVLGYYLIVIIGRNGLIGRFLEDAFGFSLMFTWEGAALAASVAAFPLIYRSARAALAGVDANIEDAARTLGASEAAVFFRVSLPLSLRGLASGTMLAFARSMGEFGATLMIAGNIPGKTQTLSLAVYTAVQAGNDRLANVLVLIVSAVCVVILVMAGKLLKPNI